MNLSSILALEDVILALPAPTKADLMRKLACHAAARTGLDAGVIEAALLGRERLGSTGVGNGVALPHASIAGLEKPFATLAVLKKPIEFDAVDDRPVDVVFLLLPAAGGSGAHLKILAAVARKTHEEPVLTLLRRARDPSAAYAILTAGAA
ncbi:PTS IIA-like nitrogen-regulatory protein PtsN [Camelimonas fluminis]|uniref:PTS sugar transporter subunit IIA n=1 Tax=Camelimonas fluminis TaxID=1576911 RepID=A0ABV7UJY7_9HYPH|nr:PTS sugar transporter subunit IIA [Camelimonas fluminis]GHE53866.1 PTS IIA-like nitrogen-regulatory protein PtsN [Camelimonas fluminis]